MIFSHLELSTQSINQSMTKLKPKKESKSGSIGNSNRFSVGDRENWFRTLGREDSTESGDEP